MEPAHAKQAKTPQPAVARRLFAQACELSGGIMTTRVHGYSVARSKYQGEPVLATTLALGQGVSIRICMSPRMAAAYVEEAQSLLAPVRGRDGGDELAAEGGQR